MNSKLPSTKIAETPLLDKMAFLQPCSRTFRLTRSHTSSPFSIPSSSVITIRSFGRLSSYSLADPSLPVSYRPIALSGVHGKLFQKILNKRLLWYLEFNNILSPFQYGVRKGRNTSQALFDLQNEINMPSSAKSCLCSVIFDLQEAFPRVWRHYIVQ